MLLAWQAVVLEPKSRLSSTGFWMTPVVPSVVNVFKHAQAVPWLT